jgi:hypothetical protein
VSVEDFHKLGDEGGGVEPNAFRVESHEAASVDWGGDAVEVFAFHLLDDLHEHVGVMRDLGGGEALGLTGFFEDCSE